MNLNHYTPISLWVSERHVVHKDQTGWWNSEGSSKSSPTTGIALTTFCLYCLSNSRKVSGEILKKVLLEQIKMFTNFVIFKVQNHYSNGVFQLD